MRYKRFKNNAGIIGYIQEWYVQQLAQLKAKYYGYFCGFKVNFEHNFRNNR